MACSIEPNVKMRDNVVLFMPHEQFRFDCVEALATRRRNKSEERTRTTVDHSQTHHPAPSIPNLWRHDKKQRQDSCTTRSDKQLADDQTSSHREVDQPTASGKQMSPQTTDKTSQRKLTTKKP